ncbi:unnamed protein product, partial [Brenthis ino]
MAYRAISGQDLINFLACTWKQSRLEYVHKYTYDAASDVNIESNEVHSCRRQSRDILNIHAYHVPMVTDNHCEVHHNVAVLQALEAGPSVSRDTTLDAS